ncbi:sugar phosphate isomerase/epimerase family protein [Nonomuraea sp. SBT364]|uniref:sugar phosphate isomerase/epimerase family protein n=1 Tax=Nonomuraea sp. SBT364 TaxID=1580530 RepID=UPI00066CB3DE|nr:sugar phosphate isomerase/epimerase family protein [Nonomuraea sp. SBT364]
MKLAFSTLGCPGWTWAEAVDAAVRHGFDGIEWRLVDGHIIGPDFPPELALRIAAACAESGLAVPALDSSIDLAAPPGPARERVLAETRSMLRLAAAFSATFLRVFPGAHPPDAGAAGWLREALEELRADLRETGVRLALELHDSRDAPGIRGMSCSQFVAEALTGFQGPEIGVQWDLGNPYLEGEQAAQTWENIRPWLLYLQAKDMAETADGWKYVLMGEGGLPLREVLGWIGGKRFDGWVSLEWEKYWNPELAEPQVALPQFVEYMKEYR